MQFIPDTHLQGSGNTTGNLITIKEQLSQFKVWHVRKSQCNYKYWEPMLKDTLKPTEWAFIYTQLDMSSARHQKSDC